MTETARQPVYEFGEFRLDAQRRVLFGAGGESISLAPRLIDLLLYLVERPCQLLTKEELLDAVWPNVVVEEHNLNKAVSQLRRALGEEPREHKFIVTKPGRGYLFVADVSVATSAPGGHRFTPPAFAAPNPAIAAEVAGKPSEASRHEPAVATDHGPAATSATERLKSPTSWLLGLIGTIALVGVGYSLGGFLGPAGSANRGLHVTPLMFEKDGGEVPLTGAVWKPDSTAIAFAAFQRGGAAAPRLYALRIDDTAPIVIAESGLPQAWTRAGQVVFNRSLGPTATSESAGLWAVPAIGGEAEPLFKPPAGRTNILAVTADGQTVAALRVDENGAWGVWAGSIAGGTLEHYAGLPLAPTSIANSPWLSFSPDGRQLLLMWNPRFDGEPRGEQSWLLPYPPNPQRPPRRILEALPSYTGTPQFSWLPDNRHIVVSTAERNKPRRLYLADTESGRFRPLTDDVSTTEQLGPVVSPDGTRLVFSEFDVDLDIVTIDVRTAAVSQLIATTRNEQQPSWAADGKRLVYATDRDGQTEIRLREPDGTDRPLVTPHDFPAGTTLSFMVPEISPDGTRVMYLRVESDARGATGARLWMSSLSGGAPMRLRDRAVQEHPGSWSPDGAWYVYEEPQNDGTLTLKKARTSGTSEPESLATGLKAESVPVWSPDGHWILFEDDGVKLIAEDKRETRELGVKNALCTFARAPELLYCFENVWGQRYLVARSFDGATRRVGSITPDQWPRSFGSPGLRLSLTPGGDGLTYAVASQRVQLLLADGLADVPRP